MITVTKYDLASGAITGHLTCDSDLVEANLSAGEGFVSGNYSHEEYVVSDGQVVPRAYGQEALLKKMSIQVRLIRNDMLVQSDWTQLPDAPVDQAAWAVYRQELRDLPANTEDPSEVVWPKPPTS
jgi:hypothetical protein